MSSGRFRLRIKDELVMRMAVDEMKRAPLRVVALRDRDTVSLARSASGGAFPVLARPMLEAGGVVFGSELLCGGVVEHTMIDSVDDLPKLQGSKYVQSDVSGTFAQCLESLRCGHSVLYSGTPCQIYALRSYLAFKGLEAKAIEGLYTVDLVCHGVTSPALFRLYVSWLEGRVGAVPGSLRYEFRSKRRGWGLYYCYHYTSKRDGRTHSRFGPCDEDPYYAAFLEGRLYRSSCYTCRFACPERVSDFTIGDYWGIEVAHPGFDSSDGASLLLVNSEKGLGYFSDRCESRCDLVESTIELASRENRNLTAPPYRKGGDAGFSREVSEAVRNGDADLLFGTMLRRPFSLKRAVRKILPECVVETVKRVLAC